MTRRSRPNADTQAVAPDSRDAAGLKARLFNVDLLFSLLTQIANKVPALVTAMILTRVYSTESMGLFFFATAVAFFVSMFAAFGTNLHLVRIVATTPEQGLENLGDVLALRIPLTAAAFLLINGLTVTLAPDLLYIMLMVSLHFLLGDMSHSFGAFLIGLRRFRLRFIVAMSGPFFLVASVAFAVYRGATLEQVLVCYVLASLFMLAISYLTVRLGYGRVRIPFRGSILRRVALSCWPLLMLDALQIVQFKIDTLMIFSMVSAKAVAQYETAYRLLEVTRLSVRPLAVVVFPLCVALATRNQWPQVRNLLHRTALVAGLFGLALAVAVTAFPDLIMRTVWGDAYQQSGDILRVLFFTAPLLLIGVVCASLANAIHLERTLMTIMALATLLNLALNFWAIPIWGAIGAAWTTFATELFIVSSLFVIWQRALAHRTAAAGMNAVSDA